MYYQTVELFAEVEESNQASASLQKVLLLQDSKIPPKPLMSSKMPIKNIYMKTIWSNCFCALGFWLLTFGSNAQEGQVLRVLSFNILHGATTEGTFDLDRIAKVILDAEPDFVALQEVDFRTRRAKDYDLATELGWRAKMAPLFGRAMPYDGGEYGEGLLSKYTILSSKNVALPHSPGNEPRAALYISTILPSGDTVAFVGTHLEHQEESFDRINQAKAVNDAFLPTDLPIILAGDLNDVPGSAAIQIFESMWKASYHLKGPQPTFPSDSPKIKIDYVMVYPEHRWEIMDTEVICDTIASDHCAYLVTLRLLPKQ